MSKPEISRRSYNLVSLFGGMDTARLALELSGITVSKNYYSDIKPAAIELTMFHNPDTILLGDILNWKKWDIEWAKIDFIASGSPCFVKGTKVVTSKGYKNIEDVIIGDSVMTHKNRFREVIKVGGNINDTILLNFQGIKQTQTTYNHPYYVREMSRKWDNSKRTYKRVFAKPIWKEAGSLIKGDFVGIPINKECSNPLNLTKEECYILGRYIADGHTRKDFKKRGDGTNRHWQLILSIGASKTTKFTDMIADNHYNTYAHSKSVNRIIFSNKRLVLISEEYCGIGAKAKKIPQLFLDLPKTLLESVLDGYMDGDGSVSNGVFKATSISEELIQSLSMAVAKVYNTNSSYVYTKRPRTTIIEGRVVNQNDTYTTSFMKEIKKQSNAFVDGDIIWLPFKSSHKSSIEKVYNIEVNEDNSYTANNAIVHNCQDLSVAGKRKGVVNGSRSSLFFIFVDILNHVRKLNPNVLFLQENVGSADVKDVGIMSRALGVYPVRLNSNRVVAQNRDRYYWTNIKTRQDGMFGDLVVDIPEPKDRKIMLNDILTDGFSDKRKAQALLHSEGKTFGYKDMTKFNNLISKRRKEGRQLPNLVYMVDNEVRVKTNTVKGYDVLTENDCLNMAFATSTTRRSRITKGKSPCLLEGGEPLFILKNAEVRPLNKIELCRLQGFPDNYCDSISRNKAASLLGDGWTLPIIIHILSFLDPNN